MYDNRHDDRQGWEYQLHDPGTTLNDPAPLVKADPTTVRMLLGVALGLATGVLILAVREVIA